METREGMFLVNPVALGVDEVMAAVDLSKRSGARYFEIGHTQEEPPEWWASVKYVGHSDQSVSGCVSPQAAGVAIAEFILAGARCECGNLVTFTQHHPELCYWHRVGQLWLAGCANGVDTHAADVQFDPFPALPAAAEL